MLVLIGAFIAGILTTLAPCVLPLLPVIVGSSLAGSPGAGVDTDPVAARRSARRRALVITASLGASVAAFTLLLKATTAFIGIPVELWTAIAGGILIALGLVGLFPSWWDRISVALSFSARSSQRLTAARGHQGLAGQLLTGAALGPVFSSCSPLYGYVVVTVLPATFWYGMLLLLFYLIGLCGTLLAVSLAGQRLLRNIRWLADPHGWFRRVLGLIFVLVGIAVITGFDKTVQAWILQHSPIAPWNLDTGFIPE